MPCGFMRGDEVEYKGRTMFVHSAHPNGNIRIGPTLLSDQSFEVTSESLSKRVSKRDRERREESKMDRWKRTGH